MYLLEIELTLTYLISKLDICNLTIPGLMSIVLVISSTCLLNVYILNIDLWKNYLWLCLNVLKGYKFLLHVNCVVEYLACVCRYTTRFSNFGVLFTVLLTTAHAHFVDIHAIAQISIHFSHISIYFLPQHNGLRLIFSLCLSGYDYRF